MPQLSKALAASDMLHPRTWAIEHISAESNCRRLNSRLKEDYLVAGNEWTEDIADFYCMRFELYYVELLRAMLIRATARDGIRRRLRSAPKRLWTDFDQARRSKLFVTEQLLIEVCIRSRHGVSVESSTYECVPFLGQLLTNRRILNQFYEDPSKRRLIIGRRSRPLTLSCTNSGIPPTDVTATGRPADQASSSASGVPSESLVSAKMSIADKYRSRSA